MRSFYWTWKFLLEPATLCGQHILSDVDATEKHIFFKIRVGAPTLPRGFRSKWTDGLFSITLHLKVFKMFRCAAWSLSSSFLKNYFIFKQCIANLALTRFCDDFVTTFQNNLAVIKQQIVKKYFHQSWNINCPILFNTISFYTEMISISLFLGFHIELNILGTRDISCVLHEIQIWNTIYYYNLKKFRNTWKGEIIATHIFCIWYKICKNIPTGKQTQSLSAFVKVNHCTHVNGLY